jgi:N-acetylglucosamine transport system permease protein
MHAGRRDARFFIITALIAPMAFWGVFVLWPLLQAIAYSFTDWTAFSTGVNFTGLENYATMVADGNFWDAARNNVFLCFWSPLLTLGIALFLAVMLNMGSSDKPGEHKGVAGSRAYAILFFIPQILSISMVAVMFQSVYNPRSGLLNGTLRILGLEGLERSWLADESTALWVVLAVLVWSGVGFYLVMLNAAMAGIPRELFESASLDGANPLQRFIHITLPSIRPTLIVCWIYAFMIALDSFAIVQILTVGPGGPNNSTLVLGYYIYRLAFEESRYGYASAVGVTLAFIVMVVALTARWLGRERTASADKFRKAA